MDPAANRVLVIDDQAIITQSLCEALEFQGYEPLAAFDGRQALEEISRQRPDLIVLDLLMPYMNGMQFLELLRADPSTHDIPVIILTAVDSREDVVRGIQLGAAMYITKPVTIERVVAVVKAVLGSRGRFLPAHN